MLKYPFVLFLSLILVLNACRSVDCDSLPKSYSSYENAIETIESANFKIVDDANTIRSSWIKSASYYSCNGITGYFIITTNTQKYIHEGVPLSVWQRFKDAESFGSYYDNNIRHKFIFKLN